MRIEHPPYITTSWDDGHVLDFRIADLLARHNLRGTFYIPREASTGVMTEAQVRELSARFEIGAHTMKHVFLDTASDAVAKQEISDSRKWVQDMTGQKCVMFCPPAGKFDDSHVAHIKAAGFTGLRSVELLSLAMPRRYNGLLLMPTTLQAHPQPLGCYARNIAKRRAWRNLWLYITHGRSTDWPRLAQSLMDVARRRGGVFHLWGHSWELEEHSQWQRLEQVLSLLGRISQGAACVTNGELCEMAGRAA